MAKNPDQRQASAAEFGRELQQVQERAGMMPTELRIPRRTSPVPERPPVVETTPPIEEEPLPDTQTFSSPDQQPSPVAEEAPEPATPQRDSAAVESPTMTAMVEEVEPAGSAVEEPPVAPKRKRRWPRRLLIGTMVVLAVAAAGWGLFELIPGEDSPAVQVEVPSDLPTGPIVASDPFDQALADSGWLTGGLDLQFSERYVEVQSAAFLKRLEIGEGNAVVVSFEWAEPDVGSLMFEDTAVLFGAMGLRIGRDGDGYVFSIEGGPTGSRNELSRAITPRAGVVYSFYALVSEERRAFALWERGKPAEAGFFLDDTPNDWFADRTWVFTVRGYGGTVKLHEVAELAIN